VRRSLLLSVAFVAGGAFQAFAQETTTDEAGQAAPADQTAETDQAAGTEAATETAESDLPTLMQDPKQWVIQTGDYANTRFSQLDQINSDNVGDLQVAWTFSTGVLRGHEGSPLVIGNMMYLVTPFPNIVYALDLSQDGRIIWKYEPQQDPSVIAVMCCDTVNRGVAYANDTIFLHQATPQSSRSTPCPAKSSGASRTAIRRMPRPTPRRCCQSRT
jgi:glucose dehydrogenase